jgi:hypothetical protein
VKLLELTLLSSTVRFNQLISARFLPSLDQPVSQSEPPRCRWVVGFTFQPDPPPLLALQVPPASLRAKALLCQSVGSHSLVIVSVQIAPSLFPFPGPSLAEPHQTHSPPHPLELAPRLYRFIIPFRLSIPPPLPSLPSQRQTAAAVPEPSLHLTSSSRGQGDRERGSTTRSPSLHEPKLWEPHVRSYLHSLWRAAPHPHWSHLRPHPPCR